MSFQTMTQALDQVKLQLVPTALQALEKTQTLLIWPQGGTVNTTTSKTTEVALLNALIARLTAETTRLTAIATELGT